MRDPRYGDTRSEGTPALAARRSWPTTSALRTFSIFTGLARQQLIGPDGIALSVIPPGLINLQKLMPDVSGAPALLSANRSLAPYIDLGIVLLRSDVVVKRVRQRYLL